MKHLTETIDTILFDYGNTLIEFGPDQVDRCDRGMSTAIEKMFGPHDYGKLTAIMHEERRAPYQGEFVENDFPERTRFLVRELLGEELSENQLEHLLEVRFEVMTGAIEARPEVAGILEQLGTRFRLGLISNYPCARAIRHSVERVGLASWFEVVVVSADVGHVKPHPLVFETALSQMETSARTTLYVGDNWLGDIQGAKRLGMKAVWTQQFVPYEKFDREPDHFPADAEIVHLSELLALCPGE
jgi:HAD superfamily hydrolase (TIGR01549 family)